MTNGEKHIEKLLSWYKEAVTEDGVCYLTSEDKNTLAYAIKCCKHFEDIKKHSSDVEERLDDSDCTIESVKSDNKMFIDGFKEAGEQIVIIEDDYSKIIEDLLSGSF